MKPAENYSDVINPDGSMNFDLFKKVYRTALIWGSEGYKASRDVLVKQRREVLESQAPEDRAKYLKLCFQTQQEEQIFYQKFATIILQRYMLSFPDFQGQVMQFMMDPVKQMEMTQIKQEVEERRYTLTGEPSKQQNYTVYGKDQGKFMPRELCMDIHFKLHKMSVDHLKELKKLPQQEMQAQLGLIN